MSQNYHLAGLAPNLYFKPQQEIKFTADFDRARGGAFSDYESGWARGLVTVLNFGDFFGNLCLDLGCGGTPISNEFYRNLWFWEKNRFAKNFSWYMKLMKENGFTDKPGKIIRLLTDREDLTFLEELPDRPLTFRADLSCLVPDEYLQTFLSKFVPNVDHDNYRIQHKDVNTGFQLKLEAAYKRAGRNGIDSIIASSVLDYINWQPIFIKLDEHLNIGGRILINYMPMEGYNEHFSAFRPSGYGQVKNLFENVLGYKILAFPNNPFGMVLIAQKVKDAKPDIRYLLDNPFSKFDGSVFSS